MDKYLEFWFAIVFVIAKDYIWLGHMTCQLKVGGVVRPCQLKVGGVCVLPATAGPTTYTERFRTSYNFAIPITMLLL